jgi:nitrous oxide reductase accessory protein NosL
MVGMKRANLIRMAALCTLLLIVATAHAQTRGPVKPSKEDKCPVCGMFVYKYPDWLAQIIFKDGAVAFFDGVKDLFKYYFNLGTYRPGKTKGDVAAVHVNEYYDMRGMDAREAFFVMGSDVFGPMGHELIPFATEEDARTFMKDHKGKRILRFEEITPAVVEALD